MPSRGRDNFRRSGRVSLTGLVGTLCRRGPPLALLAVASSTALAFTVTINPGTRPNSLTFAVTTISESDKACPASSVS